MSAPRILAAGEAAVAFEFGDGIDPKLNGLVQALDRKLLERPFDGFQEAVPTYRSLLVLFDPFLAQPEDVAGHVLELACDLSDEQPAPAPLKEVPTLYDGEDLDAVAKHAGLTRAEVVAIHSASEYRVYMLGFSPGFAYMGLVPKTIETRRRATPRTRVPPGSVAIAGRQTAVYPSATPGGWNLIGRSSLRWFDARSSPPTFFLPGDRVRFVSVSELEETHPLGATNDPPAGDPTFEVLDGGLLTTVQDLGRMGNQRYGVPVSGAADAASLRAANLLVGNDPGAAALECTVVGPSLSLLRTVVLSICGADLGAVLERGDLGRWEIPVGSSFLARAGNVLSFNGRRAGCRAYIAVAGGLGVPEVLGSRATYVASALGGHKGRPLERADILTALPPKLSASPGRRWPHASIPSEGAVMTVRLVFGLQEGAFTKKAKTTLTSSEYLVAPTSDRMGCRLEGPRLQHKGPKEITTDGMVLGAVQVPPDGQPIVMLADRATTGGYPKIGNIIGVDLPRLAQLMPGDRLRLDAVDLEEARKALFAARREEENTRKVL
jgi:KipI family sensor histidine kinase inhibitor